MLKVYQKSKKVELICIEISTCFGWGRWRGRARSYVLYDSWNEYYDIAENSQRYEYDGKNP